jgi:hypothetical protein
MRYFGASFFVKKIDRDTSKYTNAANMNNTMIANKNTKYVLHSWVPIEKLDWDSLSTNPQAIDLLEANQDKINWYKLSKMPEAINILKNNTHRNLDWDYLSSQTWAIELLKNNIDKINWKLLSSNPAAIHLLENNQDKLDWTILKDNPAAIKIFEANSDKLRNNSGSFSFGTSRAFGFGTSSAFGGSCSGSNPKPIFDQMKTNLDNIAEYSNDQTMLKYIQDKLDWSCLSKNPNIFVNEEHQLEDLTKSQTINATKIAELNEQLDKFKYCQAMQDTAQNHTTMEICNRVESICKSIDTLDNNHECFERYILWNRSHEIVPMQHQMDSLQHQIDALQQKLFVMGSIITMLLAHMLYLSFE